MTVIAFQRSLRDGWNAGELAALCGMLGSAGRGRAWETGVTELGEAQFYMMGPPPEQACELCVSRVGGRYVLEDGAGRLLVAHPSLPLVVAHARHALRSTRWWLVARIVMVWCAIRHMIHDRIEPLLTEGEELLVHFAPQLAALA